MEKKPPEKSFQTKILKMAVKSDQVGIERKSKMQNFAWVKKVIFSFHKGLSRNDVTLGLLNKADTPPPPDHFSSLFG